MNDWGMEEMVFAVIYVYEVGGAGGALREGNESLLHIFVFSSLTLRTLRSKFEFLFVAPINYLQK